MAIYVSKFVIKVENWSGNITIIYLYILHAYPRNINQEFEAILDGINENLAQKSHSMLSIVLDFINNAIYTSNYYPHLWIDNCIDYNLMDVDKIKGDFLAITFFATLP